MKEQLEDEGGWKKSEEERIRDVKTQWEGRGIGMDGLLIKGEKG